MDVVLAGNGQPALTQQRPIAREFGYGSRKHETSERSSLAEISPLSFLPCSNNVSLGDRKGIPVPLTSILKCSLLEKNA